MDRTKIQINAVWVKEKKLNRVQNRKLPQNRKRAADRQLKQTNKDGCFGEDKEPTIHAKVARIFAVGIAMPPHDLKVFLICCSTMF